MVRKVTLLHMVENEAELLLELVQEELDRRFVAIDDVILLVYGVTPGQHTEKAIAEIKVKTMELVRSPLADLLRRLERCKLEPEVEFQVGIVPGDKSGDNAKQDVVQEPVRAEK